MAVRRPDSAHSRGSALVDEAYDLTWWLGLDATTAAAVIGDAIYEVGFTSWRDDRELEVALLVVVAARALEGQGNDRLHSAPRLTGRAFHPSSTALAPAGSVDSLAHAAQDVLALLPPDDAALSILSIRFEVLDAELAALLGSTRRRSSDLAGHALTGFRAVAAAVLLWNGSRPTCADLQDLVELTDMEDLRQGAGVIVGHAERCRACRAAMWRVTEVSAALATAPLVAAPEATTRDLVARLRPLLARDMPAGARGSDADAGQRPRIEALPEPTPAPAEPDAEPAPNGSRKQGLAWGVVAVALIAVAALVLLLLI